MYIYICIVYIYILCIFMYIYTYFHSSLVTASIVKYSSSGN